MDAAPVSRIPTAEDLYGDYFRDAMTATAEPCPECGGKLTAERMPEVRRTFSEPGTDDFVTWAAEVYRCEGCQRRIYRKVELDRETREERDHETENAIGRARLRRELRQQYGIFGIFKRIDRGIETEVQRRYPRRPDVDLLERWKERR